MAKKGTLTVRVVADTKAAEAGLDRFASKTQSTAQKLDNAGRKMTAFATVPVAAAMGLATKAASDLQQAVGGTEAVFGDASAAIDNFADKAAKSSGLSEREFREATTSIGGQLKRMTGDVDLAAEQSIELTQVAADLAATYGGTTAEAVAALGSAFRGEADPAERFNLNLKVSAVNAKAVELGLAATTSEVDDNARAQATLALIMEQSADAQGQFARESDSAAGSMQIAKAEMENASAEIGEALLPLVADLAGGVADLAGKFGELPESVQTGIIDLGGLIAAAGPIMTVAGNVGKVAAKLRDLSATHPGLGKVTGGLGGLAGKAAGVAILGQGVAFAANTLADLTGYGNDLSNLNAEMEILARTGREVGDIDLDRLALAIDEIIDPSGLESAGGTISRGIDAIGQAVTLGALDIRGSAVQMEQELQAVDDILAGMVSSGNAEQAAELFGRIADRVEENGHSADDAARAFPGYSTALELAAARGEDAASGAEDVAGATEEAGEEAEGATPKVEDYASAITDSIKPHEDLEAAIKGVNDALKAQFDPLFAMTDSLLANQEAQRAVEEAEIARKRAADDLNGAIWLHGEASDEATEAARDLEDADRGVDEAQRNAYRSALDVTTAANELAGQMRAGNIDIAAAEQQIKEWADQGLITEEQARQMKDELNLAALAAGNLDQHDPVVTVTADTSRYWAAIQRLFSTPMPGVTLGMGDAGGPIVLPSRHTGGPVHRNRAYLVGRPGAEELFVAGESGQILSGTQTDRARTSVGGGDMAPLLSEIRGLRRDLQSQAISLDGHELGHLRRRESDFHSLRNGGL